MKGSTWPRRIALAYLRDAAICTILIVLLTALGVGLVQLWAWVR